MSLSASALTPRTPRTPGTPQTPSGRYSHSHGLSGDLDGGVETILLSPTTPSQRLRPILPDCVLGFDCKGEIETDAVFWHVAAKKGLTPADFAQKTMMDFGGPGVTPHIQQKRYDNWRERRNKSLHSVSTARIAVLKHKNFFEHLSERVSPKAMLPSRPRLEGIAVMEASLNKRLEYTQKHNTVIAHNKASREYRQAQDADQMNQMYNNINMQNFYEYKKIQEKDQKSRESAVERQKAAEEAAMQRHLRREHEEDVKQHKQRQIVRKGEAVDHLISQKDELHRQNTSLKRAKEAKRQEIAGARRTIEEVEHLERKAAKLMNVYCTIENAKQRKKEHEDYMKQVGQQRQEKSNETRRKEKAMMEEQCDRWRNKQEELRQRRDAQLNWQKAMKHDSIKQKAQMKRMKMEQVLVNNQQQMRENEQRTKEKWLEAEEHRAQRAREVQEEKELKVEALRLTSEAREEQVMRAYHGAEFQKAIKMDRINSKYVAMHLTGQRRDEWFEENEHRRYLDSLFRPEGTAACAVPTPPKRRNLDSTCRRSDGSANVAPACDQDPGAGEDPTPQKARSSVTEQVLAESHAEAGVAPEPTTEASPEPTAESSCVMTEEAAASETTAEAAPKSTTETAPETTADTTPETTADTAPEMTVETALETTAEMAPETTAETAPETTAETAPETTVETALPAETHPETTAETAPEVIAEPTAEPTEETAPDTTAEDDSRPAPTGEAIPESATAANPEVNAEADPESTTAPNEDSAAEQTASAE